MTVKLRNINPLGQVDLPLIDRAGEPFGLHSVGCLEPGEVFEVSDEDAGHEPKPQVGELGDEDYAAADPGAGLLAQVANFERVVDDPPPAEVPAAAATPPASTAKAKAAPTTAKEGE